MVNFVKMAPHSIKMALNLSEKYTTFQSKWQKLWQKWQNHVAILTPKGPTCVFWQHRNFGQLATNGVFVFFFGTFTQHAFEE